MNLEKLREPLSADEIDFRVQSINKGGYATILAYKDARVDINRLDKVCGALNWQRRHTRDNHNCIVSIYAEERGDWVNKEDTGVASMAEAQKGLASDSFKRACFNWGIGIELYDYPVIQVKLNANEFIIEGGKVKQTYELKLRDWVWTNKFEDGKLVKLTAHDDKGKARYSYDVSKDKKSASGKGDDVDKQNIPSAKLNSIVKAISEGKVKKDRATINAALSQQGLKDLSQEQWNKIEEAAQ